MTTPDPPPPYGLPCPSVPTRRTGRRGPGDGPETVDHREIVCRNGREDKESS